MSKDPVKKSVKPFNYPPKILVAWGEAISGNRKIRDWLIKNNYPELGLFCYAMHNDNKSRSWLMENGFPHLLALLTGGEGDENAVKWLKHFGYKELAVMANIIDGEESEKEILEKNSPIFAIIALKIQRVKIEIAEKNSDPRQINP